MLLLQMVVLSLSAPSAAEFELPVVVCMMMSMQRNFHAGPRTISYHKTSASTRLSNQKFILHPITRKNGALRTCNSKNIIQSPAFTHLEDSVT